MKSIPNPRLTPRIAFPSCRDDFGTYSHMLWKHDCDLYNFTQQRNVECQGQYSNESSYKLKWEMNLQPDVRSARGRLTVVLSTNNTRGEFDNSSLVALAPENKKAHRGWGPDDGLRMMYSPKECPASGCPVRGPLPCNTRREGRAIPCNTIPCPRPPPL